MYITLSAMHDDSNMILGGVTSRLPRWNASLTSCSTGQARTTPACVFFTNAFSFLHMQDDRQRLHTLTQFVVCRCQRCVTLMLSQRSLGAGTCLANLPRLDSCLLHAGFGALASEPRNKPSAVRLVCETWHINAAQQRLVGDTFDHIGVCVAHLVLTIHVQSMELSRSLADQPPCPPCPNPT